MCGRFVGYRTLEELRRYFPIDRALCAATSNYNVAPSQQVLAIVRENEDHVLDRFHWGLVPFWAKDVSIGQRMINARAETVATKPSFRNAFGKRRCLILADGFYEWTGKKGNKQPVLITLPSGEPFAFAGLWEIWNDKSKPDSTYQSCTIITTAASEAIKPVHNRMPMVLRPEVYADWLAPHQLTAKRFNAMISEQIVIDFALTPVSKQVNSVRNNDPSNIEPYRQIEMPFDTSG